MTRKSRSPKIKFKQMGQQPDYSVLITALLLSLFGVIMIYDASVVEAFRDFSDKYHFARLQAQWALVGIIALLVASKIPLALIKKLSLPIFLATIGLLIAVLIPGIGQKVQGARRWIELGFMRLQPSELVKFSFVLYLATWLEKKQQFWQFLLLSGLILGLVMAQPDLGTSIVVIATGMTMYFLSGAPLGTLIIASILGLLSGASLILSSPYRRQRLLTFLNPTSDPLGASYHIRQILIALGSGGFWGVGIGRSRQKYEYLPEATTDSIFAVIGEEIGFLGAVVLISLFIFLIYKGFKIAQKAPTPFTQLLAGGITSWIGLQMLINLASMVALVPLTGIPLPLLSYGGSSLVTVLGGLGILVNISRQKGK